MNLISLTAERLRECLDYDPATGIFTYRISRHYRQKVGAVAGAPHGNGYLRIAIDGVNYYAHRLAWLHAHGEWPEHGVDHANSVRSDNRLSNLRKADQSQNLCNKGKQSNNSSGLKGVSWHAGAGKWVAQVGWRGEHIYLGLHEEKQDAHAAYCAAAGQYHGEFARHA